MIEERAVGAQFKRPYIHIVVNNSYLGLIRQSKRGFTMDYCVQLAFDNINTDEGEASRGYGVDHVKVVEGLGCKAIRVHRPEDFAPAMRQAEAVKPMLADVSRELNDAHQAGANLLFEGAQGTLLDVDHGTYPYGTSSNCVAGNAAAGAGVGPGMLHYILGITKAYCTRVGSGPFPTELFDEVGAGLAERGHEFGSVTGRARRCGWFDAAALKRSIQVNGISGMCITKLDVMDGIENINICVGYMLPDGSQTDILPFGADAVADCVPIYETLPGWSESTVGVKDYDKLPANAKAYLKRIEEVCGAPVAIVSTGPDREETIVLQHPFA